MYIFLCLDLAFMMVVAKSPILTQMSRMIIHHYTVYPKGGKKAKTAISIVGFILVACKQRGFKRLQPVSLYQNNRYLAIQYYTKPYYFVGGFAVTVWL